MEKDRKEVDRFLSSLDFSAGESLEELEKWAAAQPLTGPVRPEPQDFEAANQGLPAATTEKEQADRYRLAQANYLLRKWRASKKPR